MNTEDKKSSILHTLATNWRDLLAFAVIGLGLASSSGVLDYVSTYYGNNTFLSLVLPSVSNYLQGFSKFVGAGVCASILWMATWPTVSKFGNHFFEDGWGSLTIQQQFFTYVGLIATALIAGSICFA